MLLFYLLIGLQCPTAPVSLLHKLEAVFMNVEMSDFYSCLQQAKWFICHSDFPVCKFDKIRKKMEDNSNMQEKLHQLQKNSIMSTIDVRSPSSIY